MDNAKSVRKEDMKMKHVDTASKDDRSVESLLEFIEGGESSSGGGREKKQKRKKKKSSPTGNAEGDDADKGGIAVAKQDKVTLEPISEGLSEVGEASGVCKHLKKVKRKKKQSDREILKSADENKLDGTNDVASGSKEIVERVEAEKKAPTSLEEHEDKQELLDHGDPLTQELMAKEADLHQLLESEVDLVESKGKEMSALLSSVDRLEDEKHDVDKKVAEIEAQLSELKISKDQMVRSTEDKVKTLEKLLRKKNKLEKFITEKVSEKKATKSQLEKEINDIKVRLKETQRAVKSEAQPETSLKLLVEYINDQIESKERELECPVCLALASKDNAKKFSAMIRLVQRT